MTSAMVAAVVVAVIFAVVMGVQAFTSEGPPSTPAVALQSGTLTPGAAQVVTLNFQAQMYSQQPPNGIDQLPPRVVYSVWQNQFGAPHSVILNNASVGLGILSSSGNFYTLGAAVSVSLPALCTGAGCQVTENLTVLASTQVPVWYTLYASATTKAVFSTAPGYSTSTPMQAAAYGTWAFNAYAPILAAVAVGATVFIAAGPAKPVPLEIVAALSWVALAGVYVSWVVL